MYGDSLEDTILDAFLKEVQDENNDLVIKILLIIANIGFLLCATTSIPLVYYTLKQNFFSTYKFIIKNKRKKKIEMEIEEENNKIMKIQIILMIIILQQIQKQKGLIL